MTVVNDLHAGQRKTPHDDCALFKGAIIIGWKKAGALRPKQSVKEKTPHLSKEVILLSTRECRLPAFGTFVSIPKYLNFDNFHYLIRQVPHFKQ